MQKVLQYLEKNLKISTKLEIKTDLSAEKIICINSLQLVIFCNGVLLAGLDQGVIVVYIFDSINTGKFKNT